MTAPLIDFYFDFSSPYSYIANEWVDALAARHGRVVRRHAILLGVTFQAAELKSPVSYPIKGEYSVLDFARSARFEGLPFTMPAPFPIPTQNAARVFWWLKEAEGEDAAAAWSRAALRAFFTRGVPLNDADALARLAVEAGQDAAAAKAAWNDPRWKDELRRANASAIACGVFGAPFFMVDGAPFWGDDRKAQLERWLASGPF
ncbi:MAG: 2-hydroxychromene-2-carboxylate isomerase [Burkholderiales bacterium]|nr:2-hydroxychromene-2-carboxylate isomerase [Burkholderiales bacterium]